MSTDYSTFRISTIVLKHDNSSFDFSFASESEGTKRFLLLVNLLLINNDDLIFAMDEIDRSWHPKLTQRFLELFMKANQDKRILILCSTYENFILSDDFFFVKMKSYLPRRILKTPP